mmetsp:Transcript_15350/g.37694  ORF Transcript_15350/g.37694 Transcript_15350/m.37694 type:complete len:98 (+) Transcript_15350:2048-2341(+)
MEEFVSAEKESLTRRLLELESKNRNLEKRLKYLQTLIRSSSPSPKKKTDDINRHRSASAWRTLPKSYRGGSPIGRNGFVNNKQLRPTIAMRREKEDF